MTIIPGARLGREVALKVLPEVFAHDPDRLAQVQPTTPAHSERSAEISPDGRNYDVSPDGKRFIVIKNVAEPTAAPPQLVVVLNWYEELKKLVP